MDEQWLWKCAGNHLRNAKMAESDFLKGWHQGCANAYHEVLIKLLGWDEFQRKSHMRRAPPQNSKNMPV